MTFEFEAKGTRHEGRTERIEQHKIGDDLVYHRNPRNQFDKQCIEILDSKKANLGNVPAELSEYISPCVDGKKVKISGSISSIKARAARGPKAQKAELHCLINISPTDQKNPIKWLLDSRIKYLKNEKSTLEIRGRCKIRYLDK